MGNGHWQSAVYVLWDSIFAVGLCLGCDHVLPSLLQQAGKVRQVPVSTSYAVYIIHIPIIVFLAYALRGVPLAPMLKFGLASIIIVPVCFVVAYIVRKIPFVSKVI